jgi:alpha-glucosidase
MNGLKEKTIEIPLSFLKDGKYQTVKAFDNSSDPNAVEIENSNHTKNDVLKIKLQPGGGYIERFKTTMIN